ncbi:MAG: hypothetical protein A2487_16135 [Candidatus Raymondbacteria bacterium RifOxyC12_full_50_8]|nr:MAG: hypothetical protein A2487_16135 [Candidatus Raymondbacteria bacterium RifOxyC12_full_50_8]
MFPDTPEFTSCDLSLYTGGPCELDRIQVLHSFRSNDIGGALICSGIYAGGDFLKIIAACKAKPKANRYCRFYRGYSGWGANQLETEMEANAWIVCKAARDIVFSSNAETMWPQVLKSMGGYYSFLATMPPDLSAN